MRSGLRRASCACVLVAVCSACAEAATSNADDDDGPGTTSAGGATSSSVASVASTSAASGGACATPTGNAGVHQGDLVDPALSWEGYVHGEGTPATIQVLDYYDCNGSRGIHALVITQSALWCGPCQADASALDAQLVGEWSALGIHALTLMVEHNPEEPATLQTASTWKDSLTLDAIDVAVDPVYSFDAFDFDQHIPHSGFPVHLLVDPRTMHIVLRSDGVLPLAQVEALAQQNQ